MRWAKPHPASAQSGSREKLRDALHELGKEALGVDGNSHLHGHLRIVQPGLVADRAAPGRPFGIHLHVDGKTRHQRRIEGHGSCQRIVQAASSKIGSGLGLGADIVVDDIGIGASCLRPERTPLPCLLLREQRLERDIEPHHRDIGA